MYEDGLGVEKDYQQAAQWYNSAAMHGASRGQYNLAVLYSSGRGVPLDYVSAYMWFSRASAAGDSLAGRKLKDLSALMTPRQKELALSRLAGKQNASISSSQSNSPFESSNASER
jgi:TPR repeat protein